MAAEADQQLSLAAALGLHRISHRLWRLRLPLAPLAGRALSQVSRLLTGVEIHPGARIGEGVFIDHGMGVVIGETAVIANRCLLYQGVTLGGTGKAHGKRHPTLQENVAANSTVVGIPGRVIHQSGVRIDPLESEIRKLQGCLKEVAAGRPLGEPCGGVAQSLKDREIIEFLGES